MSRDRREKPLTYADAGVNIAAGEEVVERIRAAVASTTGDLEVIGGIGGFAGLVEPPPLRQPVLVAAADGVGTKVLVAEAMGRYDTVGIDLVAMSVNDLVTCGARPLFFLDYLATGKLEPQKAAALVEGVAAGCRLAGCALLGGETAEMPDLYRGGEFDLAGFAVGVVEKDEIIDGSAVGRGDAVIGLPASGIHSNGFSLVRKILEVAGRSYSDPLEGAGPGPVGDRLLVPTEIYAGAAAALRERAEVHALAHVTGGGIAGNLARVIPEGLCARIDRSRWLVPRLFDSLARLGGVEPEEMFATFNMGIGFIAVVAAGDADAACRAVHGAVKIGEVTEGDTRVDLGF